MQDHHSKKLSDFSKLYEAKRPSMGGGGDQWGEEVMTHTLVS